MRLLAKLLLVTVLMAAAVRTPLANAAELDRVAPDGSTTIGGRSVRCDNVRTRLDPKLQNLGAAAPDAKLLLLNPTLLRRLAPAVQLFVFNHECGHHRVGSSELGADCWAVGRGVREGWLNAQGIGQVCKSFGDAPETPTHPSGRKRCANLDRCFAVTVAEGTGAAGKVVAVDAPQLVGAPRLLWSRGGS
jgi:hypothetical protein